MARNRYYLIDEVDTYYYEGKRCRECHHLDCPAEQAKDKKREYEIRKARKATLDWPVE